MLPKKHYLHIDFGHGGNDNDEEQRNQGSDSVDELGCLRSNKQQQEPRFRRMEINDYEIGLELLAQQ
jgi:hypothetical protein